MTIFDLYMSCDNIRPGACFYIYDKSRNYTNKELPMRALEYAEMPENMTLWEVGAFELTDNGLTVHVRIVM